MHLFHVKQNILLKFSDKIDFFKLILLTSRSWELMNKEKQVCIKGLASGSN